jgi:hypothetical protein
MRLVVIESPYGAPDPAIIDRNVDYVRQCMAYALSEGYAPYASHALYTQPLVLRDEDPEERRLGMQAGFAWGAKADEVWAFVDLGISGGMVDGIEHAMGRGQPVFIVRIRCEGGPQRVQWCAATETLRLMSVKNKGGG